MDNSLYTAKTLVRERADVLPTEITSLITDGALDVTVFNTQEEFHLTETQTKLLENEITLVLLFFLDVKGFAERIAESLEVEVLTASKIASFVRQDLFFEIEDILTLVHSSYGHIQSEIKKGELNKLQNTFTPISKAPLPPTPPVAAQAVTPESTTATSPNAVPSPQEQIPPAAVQSMRTMEGDMSRIHGYGAYRAQFPDEAQEAGHTEETIRAASQEDLLKEKPKLAPMPTYDETEGK